MKSNKFVKECGPFFITTHSQGEGLVYACIYPNFPEYDHSEKNKDASDEWVKEPRWAIHRFHGDGGGPGIFSSMAFGTELYTFLNSVYEVESVNTWQKTIKSLLKERDKDTVFKTCKKCCTVTTCSKEWKYCPVCGTKLTKD